MAESENKKAESVAPRPASAPDELVKDLEIKVSEEDQSNVKGGAVFLKLGDIKGESKG